MAYLDLTGLGYFKDKLIDPTLSVAGKAAEDKAVGDAVADFLPTDTASGAIASFPDGAENTPVKALTVDIEPVQDLNGQSSPYPPGGGKNKFQTTATSATVNGVTFTVNSDGTVTASGTATQNTTWMLGTVTLPEGNYIASGGLSEIALINVATKVNAGTSDAPFSVVSGGETLRVSIYITNGTTVNGTFKPMIRLSTVTDSTYAPYSNICPISGFAQANVTRTGVNIADNNRFVTETTSLVGGITYNESTGFYEGDIRELYYTWGFPNNANGFVSGFKASRVCASITIKSLESTGSNFIVAFKYTDGTESNRAIAYTTTESSGYAVSDEGKTVIAVGLSYGSARVIAFKDFQIEFSDTPSDYEPYQGETITIDLGETRYGGTLDVVNKVLTVDRAMVDMGSLGYNLVTASGVQLFYAGLSDGVRGNDFYGICTCYKTVIGQSAFLESNKSIRLYGSAELDFSRVGIRDASYTDPVALKAALSGQYLCYELATPITVPLSAQEMTTLLGQNNIFSDAGDVDVTYRADVKLYIQKYIASMVSAQGGE